MAAARRSSYGILFECKKQYFLVNSIDDFVDEVIILNNRVLIHHDNDEDSEINSEILSSDEYKIFRVEFTANNGKVVSARYLGENREYLDTFQNSALRIGRIVLWHESLRDKEKLLESKIQSSQFVAANNKDKDDNICAICIEEYKQEEEATVIGTLACKHSFHYQCIRDWFVLDLKEECPLCRFDVLSMCS